MEAITTKKHYFIIMIRLLNWIYVKVRYLKFYGKGKILNMLWKVKQYCIKRKYEK